MENGNLLAPKNNNWSYTCFPVPHPDDKLTTHRFRPKLLADAGRGGAGAHRLPSPSGAALGETGGQAAPCLPPFLCWRIEDVTGNLAPEKNSSYSHFESGRSQNCIWAHNSQTQSLRVGGGDVGTEGKGRRGCRKCLNGERGGGHPVILLINHLKEKQGVGGAWLKHLNTLAVEKNTRWPKAR